MSDGKHDKSETGDKSVKEEMEKDLHRPEATVGEAPSGGPNAEERSRLAD